MHHDRSPVFIIGQARSGTSILTTLVRKHLRIAFGTESQFIIRVGRRIRTWGDLADRENRRRFVAELANERFFLRTRRNYGFELDQEAVVAVSAAGTYRSVLDAVFGQLAAQMGCGRWGDKTPEYAHHLPELYALYPDARYVHVVRDGRDVALSTFRTQFGAKNVHTAARDWVRSIESVERFRIAHPKARVLDVRYEDLLDDPEGVFGALIEFLQIGGGDGLAQRIGAAARLELRSGNSSKWRTGLKPPERRRFEAIGGTLLSHYGYDRTVDAVPPGPLASLYWTADDLVRRVCTQGYWRDSLYRAGLRLGSAGRPLRTFGLPKLSR